MKILVSLTTWRTDWQRVIKDFEKFNVTEIGLFLTCADPDERKEIYQKLHKSSVKNIPLVHLRHDSERWEYDLLVKNFNAKVFNFHAMPDALRFLNNNSDIANTVHIENGYTLKPIFFELLEICGGLCLDLSHYEDFGKRQNLEGYDKLDETIKTYKIGMTHIPAVYNKPYFNEDDPPKFVSEGHTMKDMSNFDYLDKYKHLLAEYNAIELTNPIEEQLKVKEYIENKVLGDKK